MATGDLTRIRTNIAALNALSALNQINSKLNISNQRLSTGKRINSAADDPSGLTLANTLDLRSRRLGAALANDTDAVNVLSIAEGGLSNLNELLSQMVERITLAASDTQGAQEKSAILQELNHLAEEIDSVASQTQFNGITLLTQSTMTFQTGPDGIDTIAFAMTHAFTSASLGISAMTVASQTLASMTLGSVTAAISSVKASLQYIGALMERLQVKVDNLTTARINTTAAASRIMDADLAAEQLETSKLKILQDTATSQLAAANAAPQSILALFRQ